MKRIIVPIACVLLISSLVFGFNLNTEQGAQKAVQTWYTLTTGHHMASDTVNYIVGTVFYASRQFKVPTDVILGIMSTESSFIPTAINGISVGLMQVQPRTEEFVRRYYGSMIPPGKLISISCNIIVGTAYLGYLTHVFTTIKSTHLREDVIRNYYGASPADTLRYYYRVEKNIHNMESW